MITAEEARKMILTEKQFIDRQVNYAMEKLEVQIKHCCDHKTNKCDIAAFKPIAKKIEKKLVKLGYQVKLVPTPQSDKHLMIYIEW